MGNTANVINKIDYEALEQQRAKVMQQNLMNKMQQMEMGNQNSLRRNVLRAVASGLYDESCTLLDDYIEYKKNYPSLRPRLEPHVAHSKELIHAIKQKRNFPGLSSLTMSKQQEILDFAISHYEELKFTLKTIETAVRDEAIRDYKTTTWILRTLTYTVVGIVGTAFMLEFVKVIAPSLWIVLNVFTDRTYTLLSSQLPF